MTPTAAQPCVRGCTIRGQHLDVDVVRDDPEHGKTCRGCLPRPAEYGLLCPWDWQRLNSDVVDTATLVRHLRDDVADPEAAGSSRPASTGPRTYRDPAEGTVLPDAIGAADELHAALAEIADRILDEHPRAHLPTEMVLYIDQATGERIIGPHPNRLAPPDERGVWRSQQTLKTDPDTGETYVVPSTVVGVRDADATDQLVTWLLPLLPWVAEQPWVPDVRGDLTRIVRATTARWPLEEDPRGKHLPMPCPRCSTLTLHHSPAIPARPTTVVTCTNPECARTFSEDEWDTMRTAHEAATGRALR